MKSPKPGFKLFFERSVQLRGLALLALLLLAFTVLAIMIWRNLARLDRVHEYIGYSHRIQETSLGVHKILVNFLSGEASIDPERLQIFHSQLRRLREIDNHLSEQTPAVLESVAERFSRLGKLADNRSVVGNELLTAFNAMNQMLDDETIARDQLLETISYETRIELWMAGMMLAALFIVSSWYLRKRVLAPLSDLKELLLRLTYEDYTLIPIEQVDPLLVPVYTNYNLMIEYLSALKETDQRNAKVLHKKVRSATKAVIDQQISLSKAERLAAVGEFAASLAHELRNPLAGVIMSCSNLRSEVSDPSQAERLDLVAKELKRMAELLKGLLDRSKQRPNNLTSFKLAELANELISLTRYQIPSNITLKSNISENIICELPEPNLRQALLNLILNAAQAIGNTTGVIQLNAYRQTNALNIEITDDGPGFSAQLLAEGIRPFYTTRVDGTGLGLAIVQRFVRDEGGKIKLRNLQPRGGCVTLELPETVL